MIDISPMKAGDEQETYELILRVFHEFVAPVYSKNGIAKFLSMLSPDGLCGMSKDESSFVILAKDQSKIIRGMLSVINESHIALIFVDPKCQGRGIGKDLIDEATRICLKRNSTLSGVTVSSSPNSKSFYETIGFVVLESEKDEDGMRFTPMRRRIKQ